MKRYEIISPISWRQSLSSKTHYGSWSIPPEIRDGCFFKDGTFRILKVVLPHFQLEDEFRISSGREILFSSNLKRIVEKKSTSSNSGTIEFQVLDYEIQHILYRKEEPISIDDLDIFGLEEGGRKLRTHLSVERNPKLVKIKKNKFFRENGKLFCEVCGFDFYKSYGKHGLGFIECHHITPLSEMKDKTYITLDELRLVCSNCHRMIHRKKTPLTIEKLRAMISKNGS